MKALSEKLIWCFVIAILILWVGMTMGLLAFYYTGPTMDLGWMP